MIFHSGQRQAPTGVNQVMINESVVERVITMEFLGVHLDENFTWKTHLTQ